MLKKFSVENYKNFKEKIVIDFSNIKDYQYNKYAIKSDLIKTGIIYGKNGVGKTNIGLAIFDLTLHLVDKQQHPYQFLHNINADSDKSISTFIYEFILENNEIKYSYQKGNNNNLVYEEFFINGQKAFSYNFRTHKGDFQGLHLVKAENISFELKDMSLSVVRFIANNINVKNTPVKDLMNFVDGMLWFRSVENPSFIGFTKGADSITDSIIKNRLVSKFQRFLNDLGLKFKLSVAKDITGNNFIVSEYQNRIIPFWDIASSGTRALSLFFFWKTKFEQVSFLFVDEFDAFYHTELAFNIVKQVATESDFQTIFTTHNTSLLTNKLLRPDTYFIIFQDKIKPIFECTERELREGHNLEKMYRSGEFIG